MRSRVTPTCDPTSSSVFGGVRSNRCSMIVHFGFRRSVEGQCETGQGDGHEAWSAICQLIDPDRANRSRDPHPPCQAREFRVQRIGERPGTVQFGRCGK